MLDLVKETLDQIAREAVTEKNQARGERAVIFEAAKVENSGHGQ